MIKWLFITIIILIGLLDYTLVVACSMFERREEHEAYERWRKEHKDE